MSDFNNGYARPLPQSADMSVDAGLRAFMLGVYNKLAIGLVVAGALAFVTGRATGLVAFAGCLAVWAGRFSM
jgi:FtsH-binding integral membrane protein